MGMLAQNEQFTCNEVWDTYSEGVCLINCQFFILSLETVQNLVTEARNHF